MGSERERALAPAEGAQLPAAASSQAAGDSRITRAAAAGACAHAADAAHAAMDDFWREFNELYRDIAASFGLSESAWDILYAVHMAGDAGISQRGICEQMCLGKQTVNSSIHKLARDGYVSLERAGRSSVVRFTDAGRALSARVIEPVVEAEKAALADLGADDCARAIALMRRFADTLRARFSEIPASREKAPSRKGGDA